MLQNLTKDIKVISPQSGKKIVEVVGVINLAFKSQVVSRKDIETITIDQIKEKLKNSFEREIYGILNENTIIGTAFLLLCQREAPAQLSHLAVLPEFQGQRLGLDLLRYAESRAKKIYSKKQICLNIIHHPDEPQDWLMNYYQDQGYVEFKSEKLLQNELDRYFLAKYHEGLSVRWFDKHL